MVHQYADRLGVRATIAIIDCQIERQGDTSWVWVANCRRDEARLGGIARVRDEANCRARALSPRVGQGVTIWIGTEMSVSALTGLTAGTAVGGLFVLLTRIVTEDGPLVKYPSFTVSWKTKST